MKRTLVAMAIVLTMPTTAMADGLIEPIEAPRLPSYKTIVMDGLTIMSNAFSRQVSKLSLNLVKIKFNPRTRVGYLKFHGELSPELYLAMHTDFTVYGKVTRFKTDLFIGLFGTDMHLSLPELEMVTRAEFGQQYIELRLPLFRRRF